MSFHTPYSKNSSTTRAISIGVFISTLTSSSISFLLF
nr:MAG TPA: hypothetical protein [Caudoviricetes sp.]